MREWSEVGDLGLNCPEIFLAFRCPILKYFRQAAATGSPALKEDTMKMLPVAPVETRGTTNPPVVAPSNGNLGVVPPWLLETPAQNLGIVPPWMIPNAPANPKPTGFDRAPVQI